MDEISKLLVKKGCSGRGGGEGERGNLSPPHLGAGVFGVPALRRLTALFNRHTRGTATKQDKHERNHESVQKHFR